MLDLPNRRSATTIYLCNSIATGNLAYSPLPSEYYVATYLIYDDAKDDEPMKTWPKSAYREAVKVSVGMYVADFDAEQRMTSR
jgi:hypothetical protein